MSVEAGAAVALQRQNLAAFLGLLGRSSPGAGLFERQGVRAAIVPVSPERSVFNSVTYESAAALAEALPELGRAYERAGVHAWAVWVPEFDREAIDWLEAAGHSLDSEPAAMVLELEGLPDPDPGDLDWDDRPTPEVVGRINDLAYGYEVGSFAAPISRVPDDAALRLYQARVGDEPACVAATLDAGEDCVLWFVATLPEHRGRALARRLIHLALAEARVRGCKTSTLQATRSGEPVYRRLGYERSFTLRMYERRRPPEPTDADSPTQDVGRSTPVANQ